MCGGDQFYPGIQPAACNVAEGKLHQRYFPETYLKLLTTPTQPVGQLRSAAR